MKKYQEVHLLNTVTLNPALDKILYIDKFERRVTARVRDSILTMGGKGTHVSMNLVSLGIANAAYGVCHGQTGLTITQMLREHGVDVRFIHRENTETRINYLLVESSGDSTIIADKGVRLTEADLSELFSALEAGLCEGDALILSGDSSNSPDPSVFNRMLKTLRHKKLKVYLDTSGKTLSECVKESPFLVKPNLEELEELCGVKISSEAGIIEAIRSLGVYRIEVIAVTLGGDGSLVSTPEGFFRARPPKVSVANTSGCGDAFLSGMAYGFSNNLSYEDAIRTATAVSAATSESFLSVGFDQKRVGELLPLVQIEKL